MRQGKDKTGGGKGRAKGDVLAKGEKMLRVRRWWSGQSDLIVTITTATRLAQTNSDSNSDPIKLQVATCLRDPESPFPPRPPPALQLCLSAPHHDPQHYFRLGRHPPVVSHEGVA